MNLTILKREGQEFLIRPKELAEDSVAIHWLSYEDGQTAEELFDRVMKYIDERGGEGD